MESSGTRSTETPRPDEATTDGPRMVDSQYRQWISARVRDTLFGPDPLKARIGRFVLLEEIGQGGMGTVHAAYDEQLDRKVAIKVLHEDDLPTEEAETRLIREAQAMAQLNHPNVLPVYDVGHHEGMVFIAMELVDGQNLSEWLHDAPRSWSELLPLFVDAARGLQAAHDAGIAHRDFKPTNVMLDHTGRVRVMDFGLARVIGDHDALDGTTSNYPSVELSSTEPLTQTGMLVGSPQYMAPEQHRGEPCDARSDQYAFCVALWKAVYGVWPFEADDIPGLGQAKARGEPVMPSHSSAPRWLHDVMVRGLCPVPTDRFESMSALARALEHPPSRPGRRFVLVGALALAALGGLVVAQPGTDPCGGARDRLGGVWDSTARARTETAVADTGLPYADDSWERLSGLLDRYADELATGYVEACTATLVDHEQPEATMDARMRCLDYRREQLGGLRDALQADASKLLVRSVMAARRLPSVASCSDPAYVEAELLPADDPAQRDEIAELRARLARAQAMLLAADHDAALATAQQVQRRAADLGHAPLVAETGHVLGDVHLEAGRFSEAAEVFRETYFGASERGQHELKANIATHMVYVLGYRQAEHEEAATWVKHATADVERLGDERARAKLLNNTGLLHGARGEHERALESYRQALEIRERLADPEFPHVAVIVNNMGIAHKNLGRAKEALEAFERAVAIKEQELGPDHPEVASTLNNVAVALDMQADYARAEQVYRRVLSITEPALGPDHVDVARTRFNLGNLLGHLGRHDEALEAHRRALEARERAHGPHHPDVAHSLNAIGIDHSERGESELALEYYQRALAVREQVLEPSHPDIGGSLNNIGGILRDRGQIDDALDSYVRAAKIFEDALGPSHPNVAIALTNAGIIHAEQGRTDQALEHHHRALSILERSKGPEHPLVGTVLGFVGDVHHDRAQYDEALEHHRRALQITEKALGPTHPAIAERTLAIGRDLLEQGDPQAALEPLERAVSVADQHDAGPRAAARFALARALAGTDHDRARRLARAAVDRLRSTDDDPELRNEIETWLRGHP